MPDCIQQIDETILFYLQEHLKSPALDRVMVFLTALGNAGLFWIAAAFVLILIRRYQKCGFIMLCTITLSRFLGEDLLKPIIGRLRPCAKFPEIVLLIPAPQSSSFPSGHTMIGFACATVLYHFNHKMGVAGFLVASLIAFSRLYLFVHYPSDILGGILYGTITSLFLLKIFKSTV